MISYRVWQGNCYDTLTKLANRPVERNKYILIISSPPYYNHGHYGEETREIGQEQTSSLFIEK